MTIKELKELLANANDDDKLEIADGEIKLVKKPIEYKFKVDDKVTFINCTKPYTITDRFIAGKNCPVCVYELDDCENVEENKIELYVPKDITERIKTFEDAVKWCQANGKGHLYEQWCAVYDALYNTEDFGDIHGYFKLRIITVALNEGWEPTFGEDEERWRILYDAEDDSYDFGCSLRWETAPNKLILKSERLAEYAAHQFRNIYADFCGCKKGGKG